jgi:hypothetical protein
MPAEVHLDADHSKRTQMDWLAEGVGDAGPAALRDLRVVHN